MTTDLAPDHRYTVISADAHAGADIADYRPYLAEPLARRVRRLGGHLRQPVRRPARPDRLPQLGLGEAPGRERGRRDHRRGAVPEHRPALLRGGEPGGAPADRGRLRATVGRAPGPQPVAGRLLRQGARAAGPASPRSSPTGSRTPSPRSAGPPNTSVRSAASSCPRCRPGADLPGLWDPAYEPLWDPVRGARRAGQHPWRRRASPTTATPRWPGPSC